MRDSGPRLVGIRGEGRLVPVGQAARRQAITGA